MASVKNLKKDINYILGDIIGDCYTWELNNPKKSTKKAEAIIDEAVDTFDTLIAKVYARDVADKKAHFKAIRVELGKKAKSLSAKIEKL